MTDHFGEYEYEYLVAGNTSLSSCALSDADGQLSKGILGKGKASVKLF